MSERVETTGTGLLPAVRGLMGRAATRVGQILTATDGRDVLTNAPDGWAAEQPGLWWDGDAGDSDGSGGTIGNPPPNARGAAVLRTLPAMGKCRQLTADTLAGVPWQVFRGDERLPTPEWILDPQGMRPDGRVHSSVLPVRQSAVEFWSAFLISAIELGEGIVYVPQRGADGQPIPPLFLLSPYDLTVERGRYWVRDVEVQPEELIIVRSRVWPGRTRGVGIWQQYADEIGLGHNAKSFADRTLGRGVPAGYLKVTQGDPDRGRLQRLQDAWMAAHGGSRRKIAVLNAVTEFHPLEFNPQALQLVELMRLSAWEIALMYGVPPAKLGVNLGQSMTYANIEAQQIDYVSDALLPWARRIESSLDSEMPRGTSLKLNLDGLRRGDTRSRYEAHQIGLAAGFLTKDEVRRIEDLPPLPAGAPPSGDDQADEEGQP